MLLRVVVGSLVLVAGCSKPKTAAEGKGSAAPLVPVAPRLEDPLKAPIPAMPAPTGAFACKSKTPLAVVPRTRRPNHPWEIPFELTECPTVPSIFGNATFGMDAATARAAAKGATGGDGAAVLSVGEHPFQQQFILKFDSATGTLDGFSFVVDTDGFAAMRSAWGEPLNRMRFGKTAHTWFNPAARIKAVATDDRWYRTNEQTRKYEEVPAYRVNLVPYTPLVELLGRGGIVDKPLLGKTAKEIAAAHPGLFHSDQKQLERDESLPVELPKLMRVAETEAGDFPTLIFCAWEGGRLEGYYFKIPYGTDDTLKRELLAQVVAALGGPIEARKGEYTFQAPNGLFVDLEIGFSRDEWELKVRAK